MYTSSFSFPKSNPSNPCRSKGDFPQNPSTKRNSLSFQLSFDCHNSKINEGCHDGLIDSVVKDPMDSCLYKYKILYNIKNT